MLKNLERNDEFTNKLIENLYYSERKGEEFFQNIDNISYSAFLDDLLKILTLLKSKKQGDYVGKKEIADYIKEKKFLEEYDKESNLYLDDKEENDGIRIGKINRLISNWVILNYNRYISSEIFSNLEIIAKKYLSNEDLELKEKKYLGWEKLNAYLDIILEKDYSNGKKDKIKNVFDEFERYLKTQGIDIENFCKSFMIVNLINNDDFYIKKATNVTDIILRQSSNDEKKETLKTFFWYYIVASEGHIEPLEKNYYQKQGNIENDIQENERFYDTDFFKIDNYAFNNMLLNGIVFEDDEYFNGKNKKELFTKFYYHFNPKDDFITKDNIFFKFLNKEFDLKGTYNKRPFLGSLRNKVTGGYLLWSFKGTGKTSFLEKNLPQEKSLCLKLENINGNNRVVENILENIVEKLKEKYYRYMLLYDILLGIIVFGFLSSIVFIIGSGLYTSYLLFLDNFLGIFLLFVFLLTVFLLLRQNQVLKIIDFTSKYIHKTDIGGNDKFSFFGTYKGTGITQEYSQDYKIDKLRNMLSDFEKISNKISKSGPYFVVFDDMDRLLEKYLYNENYDDIINLFLDLSYIKDFLVEKKSFIPVFVSSIEIQWIKKVFDNLNSPVISNLINYEHFYTRKYWPHPFLKFNELKNGYEAVLKLRELFDLGENEDNIRNIRNYMVSSEENFSSYFELKRLKEEYNQKDLSLGIYTESKLEKYESLLYLFFNNIEKFNSEDDGFLQNIEYYFSEYGEGFKNIFKGEIIYDNSKNFIDRFFRDIYNLDDSNFDKNISDGVFLSALTKYLINSFVDSYYNFGSNKLKVNYDSLYSNLDYVRKLETLKFYKSNYFDVRGTDSNNFKYHTKDKLDIEEISDFSKLILFFIIPVIIYLVEVYNNPDN